MRRFRIIGLALVAVFAMSAVAVSSASAALPEFVPANGKFPVAAKFTSGPGTLETVGGHVVKCTLDSGTGSIASAKLIDGIVIKFTKCTTTVPLLGAIPCKTAGAAAEEIVTEKLTAKPVYDNTGKTAVALLVANEKEGVTGLYASFVCEKSIVKETIKVRGSTLILISPLNKEAKLFPTSAKQTKGKPEDSSSWNEAGTELVTNTTETKGEGTEAFGYEESAAEGTGDLLTETNITISA
jgi:hypothetical protein